MTKKRAEHSVTKCSARFSVGHSARACRTAPSGPTPLPRTLSVTRYVTSRNDYARTSAASSSSMRYSTSSSEPKALSIASMRDCSSSAASLSCQLSDRSSR